MAKTERKGGGGAGEGGHGREARVVLEQIWRIGRAISALATSREARAAAIDVVTVLTRTLIEMTATRLGVHPIDVLTAHRKAMAAGHHGPAPEPADQELDEMIERTPDPDGGGRPEKVRRLLARLVAFLLGDHPGGDALLGQRRGDGWAPGAGDVTGPVFAAIQRDVVGGSENAYACVVVTRPGRPGVATIYHPSGRVETVRWSTLGGPRLLGGPAPARPDQLN